MTGSQWWGNSGRRGRSGIGCRGYWGRKGKKAGVGDVFQSGGSGGASIWIGDVGDKSPHEPGLGVFPEQGE